MLKFKPENFLAYGDIYQLTPTGRKFIADIAQQVFDSWLKKNGKVVFGFADGDGLCNFSELMVVASNRGEATLKALLINIEPIEQCKHPKEKVEVSGATLIQGGVTKYFYACECGAKVQPDNFRSIE